MKTPSTPVLFRVWRESPHTVIALFPLDPGTNDIATCSSYEHVGQHSAAHLAGCIRETRPAKCKEWLSLARELRGIGYRLRVIYKTPLCSYLVRKGALK